MKKMNVKRMSQCLVVLLLSLSGLHAQNKEVNIKSKLSGAILFLEGAQLNRVAQQQLSAGKQRLVFPKLTNYIDPNSIQLRASGALTILSVSLRKNFEDERISNEEIARLNKKMDDLDMEIIRVEDAFEILRMDREILSKNTDLKGSQTGVKVAELKEAYSFIHARMMEISQKESELGKQLEDLNHRKNKIWQEIEVQRSKPIIHYSEIVVEADVKQAGKVDFTFNYMTDRASWEPYYDIRSGGVGAPVKLEAKALVRQETEIDWEKIDLILSTNEPYQNSSEVELRPWMLDYNRSPNRYQLDQKRTYQAYSYAGQRIRGEVIDLKTGESMPFAKIYFSNFPAKTAMTDATGKFEIDVPQNPGNLVASFMGYRNRTLVINAPYLKFFMDRKPVTMQRNKWRADKLAKEIESSRTYTMYDAATSSSMATEEVQVVGARRASVLKSVNGVRGKKKGRRDLKDQLDGYGEGQNQVEVVEEAKDLRVEYAIQSKFSIAGNGSEQRVAIQNYDMPANYEYHAVPKIDPTVYLVAQINGWESKNLLSGAANIYFDGTFIGETYIDTESTRDTLSISMGKDEKIQLERNRVKELSKRKYIGSRLKVDIAWEIIARNNGGAEIPLIIKDQFPISVNADIKVKHGDIKGAKLNPQTGILSWEMTVPKGSTNKVGFDYSVDSKKGMRIYLE
ncbi:MAG: mucoidy inhibitor MuiA family protein [Bacteroidetes bacterium]|nr:MAG: mucoidy inhibitor MuiA family protein [Bacteroidota bacterium]